jgi:hypothetical protein
VYKDRKGKQNLKFFKLFFWTSLAEGRHINYQTVTPPNLYDDAINRVAEP